MLIYVQETLAELERLIDYAENLRQKFDLGRVASELLLDAESLDQRLREVIERLPNPSMSGNSRRHLSWMVRELKKGNSLTCRQDINDLVGNDIPGIIDALQKWGREMAYMDEELRAAIIPLVKARQFDSAVRKAFLVLTERMRSIYSLPSGRDGEDLVNVIFGKDSSFHSTLELSKRLAYRNYFSGLYGVIRNKFSHGDHDATIPELEAALSSINLCLQILEELKTVS